MLSLIEPNESMMLESLSNSSLDAFSYLGWVFVHISGKCYCLVWLWTKADGKLPSSEKASFSFGNLSEFDGESYYLAVVLDFQMSTMNPVGNLLYYYIGSEEFY